MPIIANQTLAVILGAIALIVGFVLLHDAYEARGLSKPFWTHFLPGL